LTGVLFVVVIFAVVIASLNPRFDEIAGRLGKLAHSDPNAHIAYTTGPFTHALFSRRGLRPYVLAMLDYISATISNLQLDKLKDENLDVLITQVALDIGLKQIALHSDKATLHSIKDVRALIGRERTLFTFHVPCEGSLELLTYKPTRITTDQPPKRLIFRLFVRRFRMAHVRAENNNLCFVYKEMEAATDKVVKGFRKDLCVVERWAGRINVELEQSLSPTIEQTIKVSIMKRQQELSDRELQGKVITDQLKNSHATVIINQPVSGGRSLPSS